MRAAWAIVVCAFVAAACDGSNYPSSPAPAHPVAQVGVITPASIVADSFACNGLGTAASNVTLAINASRSSVSLDTVTLHLIDGTNLSANSVTFPRAEITARFWGTPA